RIVFINASAFPIQAGRLVAVVSGFHSEVPSDEQAGGTDIRRTACGRIIREGRTPGKSDAAGCPALIRVYKLPANPAGLSLIRRVVFPQAL
ncbi:MAG: hypothetical protein VB858_18770, partial [Planctomycetaceae bacterium]